MLDGWATWTMGGDDTMAPFEEPKAEPVSAPVQETPKKAKKTAAELSAIAHRAVETRRRNQAARQAEEPKKAEKTEEPQMDPRISAKLGGIVPRVGECHLGIPVIEQKLLCGCCGAWLGEFAVELDRCGVLVLMCGTCHEAFADIPMATPTKGKLPVLPEQTAQERQRLHAKGYSGYRYCREFHAVRAFRRWLNGEASK